MRVALLDSSQYTDPPAEVELARVTSQGSCMLEAEPPRDLCVLKDYDGSRAAFHCPTAEAAASVATSRYGQVCCGPYTGPDAPHPADDRLLAGRQLR